METHRNNLKQTTMRKLELKDICLYIPYELYLQVETNDGIFTGQFNGYDNNGNISISLGMRCVYGRIEDENIKPYLYSMDWLTKPITHKGETFVPIVELAKINWLISPKDINEYTLQNGDNGYGVYFNYKPYKDKTRCFFFQVYKDGQFQAFSTHINSTSDRSNTAKHCAINVKQVMEKLYEWKFDVNNLIPQQLAIPVTEEFNPYK